MKRLIVIIACISCYSAFAQDRYFARTYTANILPKGAIDIEWWHTSRFGHLNQYFNAQDQRMELEFGLGKNVQTAFYFNRYQKRFSETANETLTSSEIGFSNEWKWKISGPASKINYAVYGEWGIKGGDEVELEAKFIADKNFGKNLLAFNAITEYEKEFEWRNGKTQSVHWEAPVEFDLAYLRNINFNWGLGFEISNRNAITKGEGWEYSAVFGGPSINYRGDRWFVIANYLPQWGNLHKTIHAPYSKVLDEQERVQARIILGISLK
ncbi:MAG: hypothetical protein WCI49_07075 [Ferruginibacter sp.]